MNAEDRVDHLFTLPPEDFVAARDALAKEVRDEGDREGSQKVKALRRPSVAAWAVNQVARAHPDDIVELLAVGDELREAQRDAMTERGSAKLQAAGARRRTAVDRSTRRAAEVLEGAGRASGTHLDEIRDTFLAATTDAEVADLVRSGRLDRERRPSSDIGDLFGLSPEAEAAGSDTAAEDRSTAVTEAERELRRARREADRAAARADQTRRAAQKAQDEAERRSRAAAEAENAATAAEEAAQAAERELGRVRSRRA